MVKIPFNQFQICFFAIRFFLLGVDERSSDTYISRVVFFFTKSSHQIVFWFSFTLSWFDLYLL